MTCPDCASAKTFRLSNTTIYGEMAVCMECGYRWNPKAPPPPSRSEDPGRTPDHGG